MLHLRSLGVAIWLFLSLTRSATGSIIVIIVENLDESIASFQVGDSAVGDFKTVLASPGLGYKVNTCSAECPDFITPGMNSSRTYVANDPDGQFSDQFTLMEYEVEDNTLGVGPGDVYLKDFMSDPLDMSPGDTETVTITTRKRLVGGAGDPWTVFIVSPCEGGSEDALSTQQATCPAPVPETGTMLMFILACAGLLAGRFYRWYRTQFGAIAVVPGTRTLLFACPKTLFKRRIN